MTPGDQRKPCCQVEASNLCQRPEDQRPDLAVLRCRECGCRHFELTVDPGKLGLAGKSV